MTVKETLKYCLLFFPTVFKNKGDVYVHWFVSIGNGYEWENGELVYYEARTSSSTILQARKKQEDRYKRGLALSKREISNIKLRSLVDSLALQDLNKVLQDIDDIDRREKEFNPDMKRHLCLSSSSHICNLPQDIKPDWLQAAQEVYTYINDNNHLITSDINPDALELWATVKF